MLSTGIFSSAIFSAAENGPQNSSSTAVVLRLPRLDLVEFFLHVARELQVHDLREMLDQQIGHPLADLGGVEAALLHLDVAAFRPR